MGGEFSAEPSMEEILSSIKRIIAEEGDAAGAPRGRRSRSAPPQPAPRADRAPAIEPVDEVLELSERIAEGRRAAAAEREAEREVEPRADRPMPAPAPEPILSERAVEATRGPLEALSRMVVRPEVAGSDTLEGLVREMLKPMLREWLDANLPEIVEAMVAREISRITGRNG